jgi:DNA-binding MarR family transcriptional regulator
MEDLMNAEHLGHEARALGSDHSALKLWLRMLAGTTQIETEIRRRLRRSFGVTLARFDYLAQLERNPQGLRMSELSRRLMVTGGNVTGLTDELEREKLVAREASPTDGRAWIVRLTPKGRRAFAAMAREHERWIVELFGGLSRAEIQQLHALLGKLRAHLTRLQSGAEETT